MPAATPGGSFLSIWAMVLAGILAVSMNDKYTPVANQVVLAINSNDPKAIQQILTPQAQRGLQQGRTIDLFPLLVRTRGKITGVGKAYVDGNVAYFPLTCRNGLGWEMKITLDDKGLISDLYFTPTPDNNRTPMRLPFDDEWYTTWGGNTPELNYHAGNPMQRRAIDWVILGENGKSFKSNGRSNEDYYCYGKPVLAPADGEVVTLIDGVPDNTPGATNPASAVGNCIIIKQGESEYTMIAHFIPYSFAVKLGDKIKAGQLLGKCGNSGNSSEPHIHFHIMTSAVLQDGLGIAPFFENVRVNKNGKISIAERYSPHRADRVSPVK